MHKVKRENMLKLFLVLVIEPNVLHANVLLKGVYISWLVFSDYSNVF